MGEHRLVHLKAGAQNGIERALRILKDHRDVATADLTDLLAGQLQQVLVVEQDLAANDPAGVRHEPQDRKRGHRFAAAGFAHDPKALARVEVKAHAIDRRDYAAVRLELCAQVAHLEDRCRQPLLSNDASVGRARRATHRPGS
jgi:hypothetical protein